jgi:hypothetical protein
MELRQKITEYSLEHYKSVTVAMVVFTLALGSLIPLIKIDTDRENMLLPDDSQRLRARKCGKNLQV